MEHRGLNVSLPVFQSHDWLFIDLCTPERQNPVITVQLYLQAWRDVDAGRYASTTGYDGRPPAPLDGARV